MKEYRILVVSQDFISVVLTPLFITELKDDRPPN